MGKIEITPKTDEVNLKIEESEESASVSIPNESLILSDKIEDTSTDTEESIQKTDEEPIKEAKKGKLDQGLGVNIVTFIGNGMWTDEKGESWHKNDPRVESERSYTNEEFAKRSDLKFMIEYGAMKHTIV